MDYWVLDITKTRQNWHSKRQNVIIESNNPIEWLLSDLVPSFIDPEEKIIIHNLMGISFEEYLLFKDNSEKIKGKVFDGIIP